MSDRLQEQVAAIWARALGVKKVNPGDNFFALGGHSLLGVKLIAEIQAKTGMEEELKDLVGSALHYVFRELHSK